MELIRLEQIAYRFGMNEVLKEVNLTIHSGDFIALLGENGAGKTTLLQIISGIFQPIKGTVFYQGKKLNRQKT